MHSCNPSAGTWLVSPHISPFFGLHLWGFSRLCAHLRLRHPLGGPALQQHLMLQRHLLAQRLLVEILP